VEVIDLGPAADNSLTLALADVLAISSTTDTLRVDGDGSVNMIGSWTPGADVNIHGVLYRSFTQDAATLLIHPDLAL
jgi:hypothetical protein